MWTAFDQREREDLQIRVPWLWRFGPLQFSLRLFCLIVLIGFVTLVIQFCYGAPFGLMIAFVLSAITWIRLSIFAPAPTKYLTVFTLLGLCHFTLLAVSVQRARDSALRNQALFALREIGHDGQYKSGVFPIEPNDQNQVLRLRLEEETLDEPP